MSQITAKIIETCLSGLGEELIKEIETHSHVQQFSANEIIIREGQYVRFLPIVISGAVKVYSDENDMQFLLYYIYPGSTCIFSFAHLMWDKAICFTGVAESDTELLQLPIQHARRWIKKYPAFSEMIISNYQKRFDDLLRTTKEIICYNLEDRILAYLKTKAGIHGADRIPISHQQIGDDLGTSREVISRVLRKMERAEKIVQLGRKIKIV